MSKLTRSISPEEIAAYKNNGVVLLKGVLDLKAVNLVRRSIDSAIENLDKSPSGYNLTAITKAMTEDNPGLLQTNSRQYDLEGVTSYIKSTGKKLLLVRAQRKKRGNFILDTGVLTHFKEFTKFTHRDAPVQIAAALLQSEKVNFLGDQVFVKEPGSIEKTAFHQDASYFEIEGNDCCVLWIPVDPVTLKNGAMMYVRKSHKSGDLYQPNTFIAQAALAGSEGKEIPDIEGDLDNYDVIHFDIEPGDVLVHHYKTIHGTNGNFSEYQVIRAASLRYCGDDIRFHSRPGVPVQLHHKTRLKDGDVLQGPDFPVVWKKH